MTKEIIVTLANVWQMAPSDAQRKGVTTHVITKAPSTMLVRVLPLIRVTLVGAW